MKIIFVIPKMTGGGTERVISLLSDAYVKMGFEVAIMQFAGYEHAYQLNDKVEDFSVAGQSNGNPFVMLKRLIRMRRYYKKNPDAYIFSFCIMGAFFSVIATFGMKRYMLVAERSSPENWDRVRLRNWAYRRLNTVTFQTADGISYFPEDIAKKAVVIPNPIDAAIPARYEGRRSHRVVSVGRLHKVKNHAMLIDSFAAFSGQYPDYELHFYGQGDLEGELKQRAENLKISDKVVWHGFCGNVTKEVQDAGMFVLSSNYEGISNSMLEALAMGIPTICTDCPIGGARMYIENGVNGFLVPVDDREALTEAMCRIASDEALADRMSRNAVKVREHYSVESIAGQFLEAAGIAYPLK